MHEKTGIERGLSSEEVEKQIAEELGEMVEKPIVNKENVVERQLENQVELLEKNIISVESSIIEIGGEEKIKEVFNKMSTEEQIILNEKINVQKDIIEKRTQKLKDSLGNLNTYLDMMLSPRGMFNAMSSETGPILANIGTLVMYPVMGIGVGGFLTVITGIQTVIDKIKLFSSKRKLENI